MKKTKRAKKAKWAIRSNIDENRSTTVWQLEDDSFLMRFMNGSIRSDLRLSYEGAETLFALLREHPELSLTVSESRP